MKISVFGCGYVGLTTAIGFAEMGNDVIGIDIDKNKIELLKNGEIPFYEPGLLELLQRNIEAGRISFSMNAEFGIKESEVIICAVATPSNKQNEPDLNAVLQVSKSFAIYTDEEKLFINKSTVPVGTSELIRVEIEKNQKSPVAFHMVSNPEFLREGNAVNDFFHPDRIIIGVDKNDKKIKKIIKKNVLIIL